MQPELRFKIISEGLKYGISPTCRKYKISRTIYYRWLSRYKAQGIAGLDDHQKNFTPANKTTDEIEKSILNLVKTYPAYGPRALKDLLDELGYKISESAIYNVLKRNNLSKKSNRLQYIKKGKHTMVETIPALSALKSGECMIFWITDCGTYDTIGHLYTYTFFDIVSRIACTRLYNQISYDNFEDLLTSVTLSVAATLSLKIQYLCFFENRQILKNPKDIAKPSLYKTLQNHGYEVDIHVLSENVDLEKINDLKKNYVEKFISFLMPLIAEDKTFTEIKKHFLDYVKHYNIDEKLRYDQDWYSPIEYHNLKTNTHLILPIWAYMDRLY